MMSSWSVLKSIIDKLETTHPLTPEQECDINVAWVAFLAAFQEQFPESSTPGTYTMVYMLAKTKGMLDFVNYSKWPLVMTGDIKRKRMQEFQYEMVCEQLGWTPQEFVVIGEWPRPSMRFGPCE